MILTSENYFSPENNMRYMSASQYKAFQRCEAAALAELLGEYQRETTTALLVGSYVDAHFSDGLHLFKAQHPEVFKRDGTLKSEYEQANYIIQRIEQDNLFMALMDGEKQVIRTGEISGVPFKIKIDCLIGSDVVERIGSIFSGAINALILGKGAIVDMKIMRSFEPVWDAESACRMPFVEYWGYDVQGAIYRAIEGNQLPFIMAAATKENEPDLGLFSVPQDVLDGKLQEVEYWAPRYQDIKQGKIEPTRCGKCDYCKSTKRLTKIIDYREV